ncbi:hypothetical protein HNQ71_001546 [Mesorhizobium sangaii]|uniref:Uncharacterized protein n=1 Tax=Mesorhizobium sangaii TaxID=505389 RepID=A0A841PFB0_9HYPH|nr:hypothetical protein [Mesorhizobium sangaii]
MQGRQLADRFGVQSSPDIGFDANVVAGGYITGLFVSPASACLVET